MPDYPPRLLTVTLHLTFGESMALCRALENYYEAECEQPTPDDPEPPSDFERRFGPGAREVDLPTFIKNVMTALGDAANRATRPHATEG